MKNETKKPIPHWSDKLKDLDACESAINWARTQPNLDTAWFRCLRPDWMMWLIVKLSGGPKSPERLALHNCLNEIIVLTKTLDGAAYVSYATVVVATILSANYIADVIAYVTAYRDNVINASILKIIRKHYPEAPEL